MLPSLGIPYRHRPFWVFILPIGFLLKLLFWLWLFFSTFKWWSVPRHSGCFSWSMSLFSETTLSSMAEKHHPYSYDISVSIFKLNLPLSYKLIQPTANSRPLWCPMHLKLVKNRIFTFFSLRPLWIILYSNMPNTFAVLGPLYLWLPLPGIFFSLIFTYWPPSYCSNLISHHSFWEDFCHIA